jgi:hypothetical protein
MNYPSKIITLWAVFLLGTLFHTQLGLMPLFHGIGVARDNVHDTAETISMVLWLMFGFFAIPMGAMIGTVFTSNQRYRIGHFWITVIYSVLNFFHAAADLTVQPIVWSQIVLMILLFGVGLLLNGVSCQWMASGQQRHPRRSLVSHQLMK